MHIFRNALQQQPKLFLDATDGGSLMYKCEKDAIEIIKWMTLIDYQGQHNQNPSQRKNSVKEVNINYAIFFLKTSC